MASPLFWEDAEKAQGVVAQANALKIWVEPLTRIKENIETIGALLPDAIVLGEKDLIEELDAGLLAIQKELEELEVRRMLSGRFDASSCFFSINAGAGGTESCDWAEMLTRMYQRWAGKHQWSIEVVAVTPGEVAGIRSITFRIIGPFAYGYAKAERGVHRLVRISPFDASNRRHTSFASVDVWPEVEEAIEIEIKPEDMKVDTFRASGAGGQHVNVTDSAVRVTHKPTGLVVSCQQERSQHQNREKAIQQLRSLLYQRQEEEREREIANLGGEQLENAWGSQIRNYVFQPYTLVKDTRTKVETGNIQAVMDGDLDPFIIPFLKRFGEVGG